jgi:hypothetical protein
MTRGQKIALGIGITTLVLAGVGFFVYKRFSRPKIQLKAIDAANKQVRFILDGKQHIMNYDDVEMYLESKGNKYSVGIAKTPAGNVNGLNIMKDGAIIETITMA